MASVKTKVVPDYCLAWEQRVIDFIHRKGVFRITTIKVDANNPSVNQRLRCPANIPLHEFVNTIIEYLRSLPRIEYFEDSIGPSFRIRSQSADIGIKLELWKNLAIKRTGSMKPFDVKYVQEVIKTNKNLNLPPGMSQDSYISAILKYLKSVPELEFHNNAQGWYFTARRSPAQSMVIDHQRIDKSSSLERNTAMSPSPMAKSITPDYCIAWGNWVMDCIRRKGVFRIATIKAGAHDPHLDQRLRCPAHIHIQDFEATIIDYLKSLPEIEYFMDGPYPSFKARSQRTVLEIKLKLWKNLAVDKTLRNEKFDWIYVSELINSNVDLNPPPGMPYSEYLAAILDYLKAVPELVLQNNEQGWYYTARPPSSQLSVPDHRRVDDFGSLEAEDTMSLPNYTLHSKLQDSNDAEKANRIASLLNLPWKKLSSSAESSSPVNCEGVTRSIVPSHPPLPTPTPGTAHADGVVSVESEDYPTPEIDNNLITSSLPLPLQPTYRELHPHPETQPDDRDDEAEGDFVSVSTEDDNDGLDLRSLLFTEDPLESHARGYSISCESKVSFQEYGLIGKLAHPSDRNVYLNVHEPISIIAVGLQGAGKSHTLSCVMESCLIPVRSITRLTQAMTTLVLHYDANPTSVCEATGLIEPSLTFPWPNNYSGPRNVHREDMMVLVSPSFYKQRKAFYGDYCIVQPLLLRWSSMTADHIKRIMRIEDDDNQLYVAGLLDLLRKYQRNAKVPEFNRFVVEVKEVCNLKGQGGPLDQRLRLLSSIIKESKENSDLEGVDIYEACQPGRLIVADLTDPLLSSSEVNGIFQILVEQFRATPTCVGGKLLVVDEAHKYMSGKTSDGLSEAIVNVSRLIRHDGIRLVVSTQSPKILAPELLELCTVAFLHRFHSPDWFQYLKQKLPLIADDWDIIKDLETGKALVYASKHLGEFVERAGEEESNCAIVQIRRKLSADRGKST